MSPNIGAATIAKKSDKIDNYTRKERDKCGRDKGLTYCNNYTKRLVRDVNGDGIPDLVLFGMKNINVGIGVHLNDNDRKKSRFNI